MPNPLDQMLMQGGELDPALKRSRLEALYGPGYKDFITPQGNFEIPIGAAPPQAAGPLAGPQGPAPFKKGLLSVGQDLANAGGMLSQAIGMEDWSKALYEKAQDYDQRNQAIPSRVPRVEDIGSMKDAAIYAYERVAENVPMIATLFLPGGIAGLGARGVGLGAKAAAGAGWTASFLTDVGLQTGESVGIAKERGQDPNDIRIIGSGLGKAALDFVPFFALANRLGIAPLVQKELVKSLVEKGFIKRAAGHIGTMIATEVPTEVMQEGINIALARSLDQRGGDLNDEEVSQLKNAAAGALAVSFALGGASGIVRPQPASDEDLYGGKDAAIPDAENDAATHMQREPTQHLTTGYVVDGELVPTAEFNPYSYAEAFDEATGQMTITGKEYQKAMLEQGRQWKYDPFTDRMNTDIVPGWTSTRTGWYFDPKMEGFTFDQGKGVVRSTPEGFTAEIQGRGSLGMYPSIELAMRDVEKYAYDSEPISGIDANGSYRFEQPDGAKQLTAALKGQAQRTPTEQALVAIEDARQSAPPLDLTVTPEEERVVKQMDTGMQRLLEARMEFLGNRDNYRTTDNQLKNSASTSLAKLDSRINAYAGKLGIPSPLQGDIATIAENPEEVFEERAQEKPKAYPNLTESETQLLDALESKEREPGGGLTIKEYEKLERLIAKRSEDVGVPASERQKMSDAQVDTLVEEAKGKYRTEYDLFDIEEMAAPVQGPYVMEDGLNPVARVTRKGEEIGYISGGDGNFQAFRRGDVEPIGSFASKQEAFIALREGDIASRKDFTRGAPRNTSGELAASMLSPARKQQEVEIIKAVSKLYNGLKIKPRIDFAHSWNTDVFPEGTSLRRNVQKYRGFVQLKDGGRVYMILNNLRDVRDAEKTFIHEVFAHYGLRAVFGPKELEQILRTVAKERGDEVFAHRQGYAAAQGKPAPVGTLTLNEAEEFIASKFEELYFNPQNADQAFTGKILALVRRFLRHLGLSKWTDKDLADILKDVGAGLRQGVIRNKTPAYWWDARVASEPLASVIGRDAARIVEGDINSLGETWRAKSLLGVLTPLQVAERFNVQGTKEYIETTMRWWARKRTLTNGAVDVAETWQKIPKKHAERLSAAIFQISEKSDELGRRLTPEELGQIFKEQNVTADGMELYKKIDQEFQTVLSNLEAGLKRAVLRQASGSNAEAEKLYQLWQQPKKDGFFAASKEVMGNLELGARLSDIENQINHLRTKNYFPYMRFGQYAITVRAKRDLSSGGKDYRGPTDEKRGEVVHFETFESAQAQQERFNEIKREFPAHLFSSKGSIVSDEEFSFLGMPPALLDLIRDHVKLSDQQTENLKELFYLRSPGRAFLRHLVKRRGTAGYSQDALRVFSSYMMNSANHIARVEFNPDLTDHLNTMRKFAEENGNVAGLVSNYFQKHHAYLMNPENDLAQLRALGFLWYLGFNVKSALVNLTQVPMVAYPYLASLYGDTKATGALANSYKRVVDWRRGKSVLSKEMEAYVARGIAEGFLDESRATELAGLAEGGVLHRILPSDKSARLLNNVSYYGSYLFRHAEKFNREVVFLASLELSKQRGITGEEAFKAARKAVQTSMFEYAKWNRPNFMRGKKSVFFLFWNYMQHLNYLAFGGEGKKAALRVNLMLLMAAGLQGLPFAENILDMIDWGGTEVREALGSKDPKVDLRADIRELALAITERPDLVMHGLGRYYGLGAFHLLETLGVPVPKVDVSGSLSAGEPIPGISELVEPSRDPDKKLGATIVAALGPVAGIGYTFWKQLMSQDPDTWKTWERAMPTAMRVASQGIRRGARGEESFRGGGAIAKFDPLNGEHRTELIANALGFAPTRIQQAGELRSAQEDLRQYWTVRRAMVLENYAWAMLGGDIEARADAREALVNFNRDAPSPKLRLSPEKIQQSLRQRTRLRELREGGLPNEKAFQPLYLEQRRLYGGGE